jgi:hypothetical protein
VKTVTTDHDDHEGILGSFVAIVVNFAIVVYRCRVSPLRQHN